MEKIEQRINIRMQDENNLNKKFRSFSSQERYNIDVWKNQNNQNNPIKINYKLNKEILNERPKKENIINIHPIKNNNFEIQINNNSNRNKQKQPIQAPKKHKMISLYKYPTLIGLNNIGSNYYLNAILQCLSQTRDLTNYFLEEKNYNKIINNNIAEENKDALQLCPIFYKLIQNLWKKNASFKSFSPENFTKSISLMSENDQVKLNLYEVENAKDFIIYILERLHNELKQPIKNKFCQINPGDQLNQYDKNNAFLHFLDEFENNTSIISDLFFGINEITEVCQFCKNKYNSSGKMEPIYFNYDIFKILIFQLDEIQKCKEQMIRIKKKNINMDSNRVSLFECFFYNQKSYYFTGDNKNYCNICKQLSDSVYTSKIFVSPNILIIILNREKGNPSKIKIDFTNQIDISDFVLTKQDREIYNLYGVITLIGESGANAHFVASCKSPVDGKWYRYNDAIVNPINDFKKEVCDCGIPYIIFFEKQK